MSRKSRGCAFTTAFTGRAAAQRGESGFSLAEVLVAVTVMAIVFIVAFSLYDNLQKSFKMSENAANEQQNTRVAFDRMVADVRMAGFNVNPDGDPNRPDEQIEGAWDNAITVRGDYDFEDATARVSPESTLGGSGMTFRSVTTGNDEIVTYGLGKPAGTGGTNISFVADVTGVPRNGSKETITVTNVDLTQGNPPYTLYRYIISPNSTTVVRQPVADNIKSLSFTYYDGAGGVITPLGGADDPNSVAMRASISKVGINVIGMTEDPDLAYIDPTDPNANTQHYRKFTLATDVTPRNLGLKGVVDIDLDDPNAPTNFTACQGHCNGTYLKWQSGGDLDITSYTVSWGTSSSNLTNVISVPGLNHYISGITGPHYYAARSIDSVGNQSNNVIVGPSTPNDVTTPGQVTGAAATGDSGGNATAVKNEIQLAWAAISGNTTNLSCDDPPYPIRDLMGYRVYKGATSGFDPNNPSQVLQSWDPNGIPYTVNALADSNVVNCRQYYYKVRGEDYCVKMGAISGVADGSSTTNVPPAAPTSVNATDMGLGVHNVAWNRVSQNTDPTPAAILIDKYRVYRAEVPPAGDPNSASYSMVFDGMVSNPAAPDFQDPNVPMPSPGSTYYYKVTALDDCLNNESADSLPDEADQCVLGGSVSIGISPNINPIAGNIAITVAASGVSVQSTALVVKESSTGTVVSFQTDNTAPYTYTWNTSLATPGSSYDFVAWVTNTSGCSDSASTSRSIAAPITCCISSNNPTISPTTGSLKSNRLYFDIINNCADDVAINRMGINWSNNAGVNPFLDKVEYNVLSAITSSRLFDLVPDSLPTVILNFLSGALAPALHLDKANTSSSPVRIGYEFTRPMLNKVGSVNVGEVVDTEFIFSLANGPGVGRCNIAVVTNPLSLVSCDPASDPNCTL